MSEQFQEVEDRLISGLGIIKIPQDDEWRAFQLFINLVRRPDPDYTNNKWNPPRGEYAKVVWMDGDYGFREDVIRYPKWRFQWNVAEDAAYLNSPLACIFTSIGALLGDILTRLGGLPPAPPLVFTLEGAVDRTTQIQFACREEAAFQLVLKGLKYDVECPEGEPSPKKVPPPNNELPEVPTGDGIGVSPPVEPPDDGGNTVPFPGDEPGSGGEEGEACQPYLLRMQIASTTNPGGFPANQTIYAEYIPELRVNPSNPLLLEMQSRGPYFDGGSIAECQPEIDWFPVFSLSFGAYISFEIVSIEPFVP